MLVSSFGKLIIDERKLKEYLLNENHPQGKSKAKFFRLIGIVTKEQLKRELEKIGNNSEVDTLRPCEYGIIITATGTIIKDSGRKYDLKTVWIQENDSNFVKFVTAYPQTL